MAVDQGVRFLSELLRMGSRKSATDRLALSSLFQSRKKRREEETRRGSRRRTGEGKESCAEHLATTHPSLFIYSFPSSPLLVDMALLTDRGLGRILGHAGEASRSDFRHRHQSG